MAFKKVLIVDDEFVGREMLRECLRWEDYGYTIVGEARNGLEALDKLKSLKPDVLFTDIRMPGMDGIELIHSAGRIHPNLLCVAISSYEEFSYVQRSIREGVVDYLIKHTFQPSDVICVLQKMNAIYDRECRRALGEDAIQRQKYLSMLFSGPAEPVGKLKWNRQRADTFLVLAVLPLYDRSSTGLCSWIEADMAEEGCVLAVPSGRFVLCIFRMKTEGFAGLQRRIIAKVRELNHGGFAGVSDPFSDMTDMHLAYLQVSEAMDYSIFFMERGSICHEDIRHLVPDVCQGRKRLDPEKLQTLLKTREGQAVAEAEILNIFQNNVQRNPKNGHVLNAYRELLAQICGPCDENGPSSHESVNGCYDRLLADAHPGSSLARLEANLRELLGCIVKAREQNPAYGIYISMAVRYIDEHIGDRLSLNVVADAIGISRIYLSQLFRKEMDTTYSKYVLNRRVEQARWLLRNSNRKIYEISQQLGFGNVHHFSIRFKEITGVSPNDFRRGLLQRTSPLEQNNK